MSEPYHASNILSLLEKAADNSTEGITIGNMSEPDRPLIYINRGFERLTGYTVEEVIGKNCRFLQGKDTEEAPVIELKRAIAAGEETTVELLNYKKDGTPFWNRLSITPLKSDSGKVTHYVGIQSDITEVKETRRSLEKANQELQQFSDLINSELEQASKTQQFILPSTLPTNERIKFSAFYAPMGRIGGDYYDVIEIEPDVYGMLIADVTGHGIPAALITFMISFAFKESAKGNRSTVDVVREINKKLSNKMPSGAFITMIYTIYDAKQRTLSFTQAGHPSGFVIRPSCDELITLESSGSLVGVFENDVANYGEGTIQLNIGDKVFLYTDAIVEVKNAAGEMIEDNEFETFIRTHRHESLDLLFEKLHQFGCDYSGKATYNDDFTLVGLEVLS